MADLNAKLWAQLQRLQTGLPAASLEAKRAGAQVFAQDAAARAPVDTGALRDSVRVEVDGEEVYIAAGGPGVEYAAFQEFGFRHYQSGAWIQNEYMRPALESPGTQLRALAATGVEITKAIVGLLRG